MSDFFKGWKRKIGVLTLMLALMFTGGWVRSQLIFDFSVRNVCGFRYVVQSFDGMIDFIRMSEMEGWPSMIWQSGKLSQIKSYELDKNGVMPPFDPWESFKVDWRWDCAGFHFGSGTITWGTKKLKCEQYIVPYWSVVVPLTLVSIWFFLSKPRPLNQKNITEPDANEGG